MKLKERIKSLSGNVKEEKIKRELEEIETINIELDHKMTKLVAENKHLKQTYNLQEKVLVITALKETLSKLKGKAVVNEAVTLHAIDPELLKIEVAPLAPKLLKENGVTRPKKYSELSATKAIQADCDVKPTNIILQGLPPEVYALLSTHKVAKELWERIKMLMQGTSLTKQQRECKLYDEFDKFAYKKEESLRDFYLRFLLLLNDMNIYNMKLEQFQVNTKFLNTLPPEWSKFMTDVKLVSDLHTTDVDQLHVYLGQHEYHANEFLLFDLMCFWIDAFMVEKLPVSNIIPYSQYVNETQYTTVQNSSTPEQQDDLILFVIEQLKTQVVYCTKINQDNKNVNEILTAELERYKDQVRILKEQNNIDKASESCAQSLEIDNLKHTLSEHLKENESLEKMVTLLKNYFQKEESRNIDRELALEKQVKELNNIGFKRNQSAQTLHMLTKPQFFYDHSTRQALGFQNPCYLKKAQKLEPKLYDGINSGNSEEPNISTSTTIVEVPKELPKAVEQHCVEKNKFQDKMKDVLKENKRLLKQEINTNIVNIVMNANVNYACKTVNECERCVTIETELQRDFIKKECCDKVTKLVTENKHLKQTYKQLYDSIKSPRVQSKEQCDDLIKQVNIKSTENFDLNASLQEKVLVITALKDTLNKLKGKVVVNEAVTLHPINPELLKLDVAPLAPKLQNNRTAHNDYLKHTQEETATLREIVKNERLLNPLNASLD
nr:hypothetical protein [Tanacetum cinerariifolium]